MSTEHLRAGAIALRNLALGANLSALAMGSPRRIVQYASETLFLRAALRGERGLPERPVWEVLGGGAECSIRLPNVTTGSWPGAQTAYLADIVNLSRICAILQPRRLFEIGTYRGYSTLHLALNAPADARVHTLDLPKGGSAAPLALRTTVMDDAHIGGATAEESYLFEGFEEARKVHLLFGDSGTFDFTPYHGAIDLFFIDGAHSYEYVRSDTRHAMKCVPPGGVIAWHDFGRSGLNGVSRFLRELRAEGHDVHAAPGGSLAYLQVQAG